MQATGINNAVLSYTIAQEWEEKNEVKDKPSCGICLEELGGIVVTHQEGGDKHLQHFDCAVSWTRELLQKEDVQPFCAFCKKSINAVSLNEIAKEKNMPLPFSTELEPRRLASGQERERITQALLSNLRIELSPEMQEAQTISDERGERLKIFLGLMLVMWVFMQCLYPSSQNS